MEIKINMKEFFKSEFLISSEKGEILFKRVNEEINKGNKIELDFSGVKSTITAFFFSAYAPLFRNYKKEEIKKVVKFKNLNIGSVQQIETVENISKKFYKGVWYGYLKKNDQYIPKK